MNQDSNKVKKNITLLPKKPENENTPVGYSNSKVIGIIYDSPRGEEIPEIVQLINTLNDDNREVYSLKFVTQSVSKLKMSEFTANTWKKYTLSKKDINIFGRPKSKSVKGFTEIWFDILIYLSFKDIKPMHRLVSKCKARLKVAPYDEKYLKTYDMLIEDKNNQDIGLLIESLMKYIKMLNKNQL